MKLYFETIAPDTKSEPAAEAAQASQVTAPSASSAPAANKIDSHLAAAFDSFLDDSGPAPAGTKAVAAQTEPQAGPPMQPGRIVSKPVPPRRVLEALEGLMVDYLAVSTGCTRVEEIATGGPRHRDIWVVLADKLSVPLAYIADYWDNLQPADQGHLWLRVLHRRIENTAAHPAFAAEMNRRVGSKAMAKIEQLLDGGLIRNPAELVAISKLATPVSMAPAGSTVINNFGDMRLEKGQTLPGNGAVMQLTLNPRVARSLQTPRDDSADRVIDAEMVTARDLRNFQIPSSTEED